MNDVMMIGCATLALVTMLAMGMGKRQNRVKRLPRWKRERGEARRRKEEQRKHAWWLTLGETVR